MSDTNLLDQIAKAAVEGQNPTFELISESNQFLLEHPALQLGLQVGYIGYDIWREFRWKKKNTENIVDDLAAGQQRKMKNLQAQLEHARSQFGSLPVTTGVCVQKAEELLEPVENSPRKHLLYRGSQEELDRLLQERAQLERLSESEQQKAYGTAAKLYQEAQLLNEAYLDYEARWTEIRSEWEEAWDLVQQQIETNRITRHKVSGSEGAVEVRVDTDFWSEGRFSEVIQPIPQKVQPEDTSVEAFSGLMNQLEGISRRVTETVELACGNFSAAEMRKGMAFAILNYMEQFRGWWLEEETGFAFEHDDERRVLHLNLVSPTGDRLTFNFRPDNTVELHADFQGIRNRDVKTQMTNVILDALNHAGITDGTINII